MSNLQQFLLATDTNKTKALIIARSTAQRLESKQLTLIEVIESLREHVNDDDATIRARTIDYLSQVIGQLQPKLLSRQQIQVLCQFFCDRIEDGGAVGGLRNLQGLIKFTNEMATMTFRAMIDHFQDLQLSPQSRRSEILELLHDLMSKHRAALQEMGSESITGIVDLVSGEKDPRNLMVIFSILKVIMVEWDISRHAEDLFDSVFCYFPITFRPPPDNPYGITAQDLKNRLRDCIAASGCFAPYSFPQLIDKLDSTSPNVRKDVLQTISTCASSYAAVIVSNYSITLWDSLKFEILNAQEEDLAEETLVALQAIAIKLSENLTSNDPKTHLARYLRPIMKECNEQLREPQHKQAKPIGQVLSALGIASPIAFYLIVKAVMPPLNTLYQDAESIAKQRALLEVLVQLLDTSVAMHGTLSVPIPAADVENPLSPFKDRLFELTSQALMSTASEEISFRVVAVKALLRLCLLRKFLQDSEIGMAVQYFDEIVIVENSGGRDDLKQEAVRALVELSRIKPDLIMTITFPAFLSRLPDSSISDSQQYLVTLEGLAQLSAERFVSDTLIRRLLKKLDLVLQSDGSLSYPQAILSTLNYILSQRDLTEDPNLSSYHENIVVNLTRRVVLASTGKAPVTALNDDATLEILGRLVTIIVRSLGEHKQKSVANQIYSLFADDSTQFTPVPFSNNTSRIEKSTMILSTALMAGVGKVSTLQYTDMDHGSIRNLLAELVRLTLSEDVPMIRQTILRQIGLLTNKFLPQSGTKDVADHLRNLISSLLETTTLTGNAVRVIFWEARGLILRLAHTEEVLDRLVALLSQAHCGFASARGFGLLLAPDEVLCRKNGAVIRLLAKQKLFNICVSTITQQFRNAEKPFKQNYLIALSGILRQMPTDIFMSEIDTLLPLLLQSLDLDDSDVKAATIQNLAIVSQESPKSIETHIGSLVQRLLKAATESKTNTANVRHISLSCLRIFPSRVKDSNLLPYRGIVTKGLLGVLDDPKRIVRKEAAECRAAWFAMDEPQSD